MAAVDDLLVRLQAMDRAVDALSEPTFTEQALSDHLIRGIAVSGLINIESFFRDRMVEWVSVINAARIPPSRLPGGTKQYEDRVVEVLPRSLRDSDATKRTTLLDEIGKSLTSLSTGVFVPHTLAFTWAGSNVQFADIEAMVSMLGIDRGRVWSELTKIWVLVDKHFPGNANLKSVFQSVADIRHAGAHQNVMTTPLPNLATLSRNVRLVCLCVDALCSHGLRKLKVPPTATNTQAMPAIRRIVKDGGQWPEYAPNATRALRRHPSLDDAMQAAIGRASQGFELVLAVDGNGDILNWSYPVT